MSAVVWALWVRGRIRTRIQIADGGDDAVAELTLKKQRRQGGGFAMARDGARWDVKTTWETVEVRRDGVEWFRAEGREAVFGSERLEWDRRGDAARSATVRRTDGSVVVRVRPGTGRRAPFATIEVDPGSQDLLPVVLGVSFILLEADAIYGAYTSSAGGSSGP